MTTVQGGDGQDVHEGEDDREESRHLPEHVPVPHRREQASDGSEAAQRLGTLGGEDVLQVVDIGGKDVESVLDTCGDALEEAVLAGDGLIESCDALHGEAQLQVGRQDGVDGVNGCLMFDV